jgi:hypothetical protein
MEKTEEAEVHIFNVDPTNERIATGAVQRRGHWCHGYFIGVEGVKPQDHLRLHVRPATGQEIREIGREGLSDRYYTVSFKPSPVLG